MSENVETKQSREGENITEIQAETIPNVKDEIIVPVKFNKQILNLDLEKAQELAQKGMKFDVISKDYDALKQLAKADGKSVGEFIEALRHEKTVTRENEILEKCGGDKKFAEHILMLEGNIASEEDSFAEVAENFPKIKSLEDLPECVIESAQLKGTLLLDEYLRYLHKQKLAANASVKNQLEAERSAMGSLQNKSGATNPEAAEFLKGLWQR